MMPPGSETNARKDGNGGWSEASCAERSELRHLYRGGQEGAGSSEKQVDVWKACSRAKAQHKAEMVTMADGDAEKACPLSGPQFQGLYFYIFGFISSWKHESSPQKWPRRKWGPGRV